MVLALHCRSRGNEPLAIYRGPGRGRGRGGFEDYRHSRGNEPLAIHPGPGRGRGRGGVVVLACFAGPGATSPWLLTLAPVGAEDGEESWCWRALQVQGQRAPGYSPRPQSGPRTGGVVVLACFAGPGATSPWVFTAAPVGAEERGRASGIIAIPGATSPWLFTLAPVGAEERGRASGIPAIPGATSPWLFTAAPVGANLNADRALKPRCYFWAVLNSFFSR